MKCSRNSLQTYPSLAGNASSYYFKSRQDRNDYFGALDITTGQLCAIGGDPASTNWTEPVWEVERFNGLNWAVVSLDTNFSLVVTNEGLAALANASTGSYKLEITRIAIKQTPVRVGEILSTWTASKFINSNGQIDICLDTINHIANPTFTLQNNLSYRTNLMNGGIQYTLLLDTDTLGQELESVTGAPTLTEYNVSVIGLFTQDQNKTERLLAVCSLPATIKKFATTPTRMGNALKFYLNLTLSNFGNAVDLTNIESSVNSIPEVTTEDKLPEKFDGVNAPFNLYLVDNLADTNVPALAVRKGNPTDVNDPITWTYFTPSDDKIKLTDPKNQVATNVEDYMVVAWDSTSNKYVPADGESTSLQLSGLFVGNHILYNGKVTNNKDQYQYDYELDITSAKGYLPGDILVCNLSSNDENDESVMFTVNILNINSDGSPSEFYVTPSSGNIEINTTGFYGLVYSADSPDTGKNGIGLQIKVTSIKKEGIIWSFGNEWINRPVYADTGAKAGLLTLTKTDMFVGWCVAHDTIKLALDLRNNATTTSYGTTRYATHAETSAISKNAAASTTTSVMPRNLKRNYFQITMPDVTESNADLNITNDGSSRAKAIKVDTYTTFTKTIECTGTDYNGVSFYGTAYRARWGDLAEYYHADKIYPKGTLVTIGSGAEEVTEARIECNGIVSSQPGYELGVKESPFDLPIALVGKVPVLFAPDCLPKFGDRVYLSKTCPGRASNIPYGECLGKIIDKRDNLDQVNSIMCSIRIAF